MKNKRQVRAKTSGSETTSGVFNPAVIPTIACFKSRGNRPRPAANETHRGDADMRRQTCRAVWGTPAKLIESTGFVKKAWAMVFLDDADEAGALAYHDLTPEGLPLAKVFVRTTLEAGESVSVSASHELVEMLVDPCD